MNASRTTVRLFILASVIAALVGIYVVLSRFGAIEFLQDRAALMQWIAQLGVFGPVVIIGVMAMAIVLSPIPSAPVALAAGAAYGHVAGTVYVAIGSELGAIIAFLIGRLMGVDALKAWIGAGLFKRLLGSQNALMGIVFVSRLMPFISFDMMSYAAGATPLRFWRFAIATLAGIFPASFLLAHYGSELASGESQRVGMTLLLLGGASVIALLARRFSNKGDNV